MTRTLSSIQLIPAFVAVYNNIFDSNGDVDATGEDYAFGVQSCDNTSLFEVP